MSNVDIYTILSSKPHNAHYLRRYYNFILACGQSNSSLDNYEEHHICPKAKDLFPEYGSFQAHPWNKVRLSIRQHYIAHRILWKAYGGSQTRAFSLMVTIKTFNAKNFNSKTFYRLKMEAYYGKYLQIYEFLNIITKEKFIGTRIEFQSKYELKTATLFCKNPMKTHFNWIVSKILKDNHFIDYHPAEFFLKRKETKKRKQIKNKKPLSKESIEKMKKTKAEFLKNCTEEQRKLRYPSQKGKVHSEDTKRKISEAGKGRECKLETKLKRTCPTIYEFKNGETIFIGTRYELYLAHGVKITPIFVKNTDQFSVKGWELMKTMTESGDFIDTPSRKK